MAWPRAGEVTVQLLIVAVPVLVTRAGSITYPVCHCVCTVGVSEQAPPVPPDCVVAVTVFDTADTFPAASVART